MAQAITPHRGENEAAARRERDRSRDVRAQAGVHPENGVGGVIVCAGGIGARRNDRCLLMLLALH